jgi:hypothetical protein
MNTDDRYVSKQSGSPQDESRTGQQTQKRGQNSGQQSSIGSKNPGSSNDDDNSQTQPLLVPANSLWPNIARTEPGQPRSFLLRSQYAARRLTWVNGEPNPQPTFADQDECPVGGSGPDLSSPSDVTASNSAGQMASH